MVACLRQGALDQRQHFSSLLASGKTWRQNERVASAILAKVVSRLAGGEPPRTYAEQHRRRAQSTVAILICLSQSFEQRIVFSLGQNILIQID